MDWESSPYAKWYLSHRRFSFTAKLCIEEYEERKRIPSQVFKPFLKSLVCHSRSEEKMFQDIPGMTALFKEHTAISVNKTYTDQEKYDLCISLLTHMKEEEALVSKWVLR